MTEQQRGDLDVARSLAAAGVPVFVAAPDPTSTTGFALPVGWQQTTPDPAVVDRWRPGMALCAVMGHGLDLVDVDPRNGGDVASLPGGLPVVLGEAATPSGGAHYFVRSLWAGSKDGVTTGIDVKGGLRDGSGRGFAFLAPTVRPSKVTGEPTAYRWTRPPALAELHAPDDSGAALAARIGELRGSGVSRLGSGVAGWWREFVTSGEPQSAAAADRAIREKLDEVAAAPAVRGADFRNVLMRAAMTLGGYVGGGYLTEGDAWARLEGACAAVWGAADADDRLWIQQGLSDGAAQPFHVYTPEDEQAFGEAAQAVAATRTAPSWSPFRAIGTEAFDPALCFHDQEFADAVIARMAPVLRYAADAGSWVVRDADAWRERDDLSGWAVSMVARLMPLGETPVPKDVSLRTEEHWRAVRRQRFMASGGSSAIARKMTSIVRAGDHPGAIELAGLDADPEVLWAGGQAWDLRRSVEVPVEALLDPATPHMRTALVAPERRPTPVWDAFVATVWPDPELRAWALRVLGVALSGYPDAVLPVLYGPERTGKTSLVSLLVKVLGSYAHAADPRLLGAADTTHASVVYALKGRRLSFVDEGPRRGHLAVERLKQLTGGGELTGNAMRSNPVTFAPTHTLVMTTNDEPPITDPALRARIRVIPCEADPVAVRAARQALTPAVWEIEAPGVLAAMMAECAAWLADQDSAASSRAPLGVRTTVDEMAAGQDPVREWATSCCVPADPGTPGRELYVAFARWHGESPLYRRASVPSETAFGRSLTNMGYPSHKLAGSWYRPLSVLGGPSGYAPWEPMPSPYMTGGNGGFMAGVGGSAAGSPTGPAGAGNPMSSPVSSSSVAGLAGSSCTSTTHNTTLTQIGEQAAGNTADMGASANSPEPRSEKAADQALWPVAGADSEPAKPGSGPNAPAGGPAPRVSPRSVSKADAARRAYQGQHEKVITKAEARRQLAEEKRRAAIAAAQGEVLELPAVVDRLGHVLPVTVEQAYALVRAAIARSGGHLDVDVETTGYPIGHPDYALRSVQLGDEVAAVVLHPVDHAEAIRTLLAEGPALGAFSATADLVPIAHAGLGDHDDLWSRMHDVVIATKLADPRSTRSDVNGLKATSAAALGDRAVSPAADEAREAAFKAGRWLKQTDVTTPIERSGWAQIATGSTTMLRYAASDVLDTAALRRTVPAPDPQVYERERLAQRMTARAAHVGIRIDGERVAALIAEHTPARAAAAELVRGFGVDNPGSSKQVAEALDALGAPLPRSPKTGAPSAAAGVIEPLRGVEGPVGALADAVLTWRHHDTVLGTFLEPYRVLCERGDGRARPTVYTLGTDTGRMSCVRPNLQQLPREGGVRACIAADPGQLMIGADFSGVELRVAAALSQDPTLLRFLADGRDLHGEIALQVWGSDPEATEKAGVPTAAKAHRYIAKRGVFGRIYGGGIETLAAQVGVGRDVMQAVIDTLDGLTPGLAAWSNDVRNAVKRGHTQFTSYSGRVIHLPREYPHKAPNYCIQGSARELLVDALVRWRDTRWGSAVLLPVHDELDVFVPAEDAEEATAELVRCMETTLQGVAIVADPSDPSPFWQDSV